MWYYDARGYPTTRDYLVLRTSPYTDVADSLGRSNTRRLISGYVIFVCSCFTSCGTIVILMALSPRVWPRVRCGAYKHVRLYFLLHCIQLYFLTHQQAVYLHFFLKSRGSRQYCFHSSHFVFLNFTKFELLLLYWFTLFEERRQAAGAGLWWGSMSGARLEYRKLVDQMCLRNLIHAPRLSPCYDKQCGITVAE